MNTLVTKLRNYFLPHRDNEFTPHFLKRESMGLVLLLVLLVELGFLVQVFVVFDKTTFLAQVLPGALTVLTNEERSENNAPALVVSDTLTRAAQMKANDMAEKGYFAHTSPEGKTPWYWFKQAGYDYSYAGENLAVNFFESKDVAEAWMNSPTHRANIVKKDYTEIGIAVATGMYEGRQSVFVAQLFGTPMKGYASETRPAPTATPQTVKKVAPKVTTTPVKKVAGEEKSKTETKKTTSKKTPAKTEVAQTPTPVETQVLSEESTSQIIALKESIKNFPYKERIEKLLASPSRPVTYILELIALIIFLSIVLVHVIAYEKRQTLIALRGIAVIAVIASLLYVNFNLSKQVALELPTDNLNASAVGAF